MNDFISLNITTNFIYTFLGQASLLISHFSTTMHFFETIKVKFSLPCKEKIPKIYAAGF